MAENNSMVAIYNTHTEAEEAIKTLQKAGFDMKRLSIVGRDYRSEDRVVGYYNTGDRMKAWGKSGAFWGGLWGYLFGAAFFFIPGIGPIALAGPIVSAIVSNRARRPKHKAGSSFRLLMSAFYDVSASGKFKYVRVYSIYHPNYQPG